MRTITRTKIKNLDAYNYAVNKNMSILDEKQRSMKVECPNCKYKINFYAFENRDRKICRCCNIWVYKDEKAKKKYEQEDFERELKKWKKIAEEKERDVNRIEGRNLGIQRNTKNRKKTR